jgi:hypothetical protein
MEFELENSSERRARKPPYISASSNQWFSTVKSRNLGRNSNEERWTCSKKESMRTLAAKMKRMSEREEKGEERRERRENKEE